MRLSRIDGWARAHDGQLDGPGAPSVQAAAATTPTRDRARAAPTRVQSHARVLAGHVVRVSAGEGYTCAETLTNQAYCWGTNSAGQLGNNSALRTVALKPVAVAGGHAFAQLSAGYRHACGKTTGGEGWCWGDDLFGALGDGILSESVQLKPVRVVAPL